MEVTSVTDSAISEEIVRTAKQIVNDVILPQLERQMSAKVEAMEVQMRNEFEKKFQAEREKLALHLEKKFKDKREMLKSEMQEELEEDDDDDDDGVQPEVSTGRSIVRNTQGRSEYSEYYVDPLNPDPSPIDPRKGMPRI